MDGTVTRAVARREDRKFVGVWHEFLVTYWLVGDGIFLPVATDIDAKLT
jgi:hypothetical protein